MDKKQCEKQGTSHHPVNIVSVEKQESEISDLFFYIMKTPVERLQP